MNNLPDFTPYGYQVIEILQQNVQGGRIAYKAIEIATNKPVVIKQFSFAKKTWDGYKEIEREINVLKDLNHHGIPKFLDTFDPDDGLCLVQEYINAQPLSIPRSFSVEEIKSIAVQLLEILVYLQERIPPIIHRDIKPENVLVEILPNPPYQEGNGLRVYLIDFGLARIGNKTMAFSSIMGGTLGFMPPEQVHNQKLTSASDLYGLGATLICLITNTKSANIGSLRGYDNKINFQDKVPKISLRFIQWLEKMVEPNPDVRFPNAETALKSLKPILMTRLPEVQLSSSAIELQAKEMGQKLTQTITIENRISDTVLEGNWSVAPHQNDPPHTPDGHKWISFSPKQFKGNSVKCDITVNTKELKSGSEYKRWLLLQTNSVPESYTLELKLKTPFLSLEIPSFPYFTYFFILVGFLITSSIFIKLLPHFSEILSVILDGFNTSLIWQIPLWMIVGVFGGAFAGMTIGSIIFSMLAMVFYNNFIIEVGIWWSIIIGFIIGGIGLPIFLVLTNAQTGSEVLFGFALLIVIIALISLVVYWYKKRDGRSYYNNLSSNSFRFPSLSFPVVSTGILGIVLGVGLNTSLLNPIIILLLIASGLPVIVKITSHNIKQQKQFAQLRQQEKNLIQP